MVEGHWENPIDMDSHHKERFFDGTVVIHRHLDRLLAGMADTDRMRARTEVSTLIIFENVLSSNSINSACESS